MLFCNTIKEFLYCAARTELTMDYLSKALKDGVVKSPPSCVVVLIMVNSTTLLQRKAMAESSNS